MYSFSENVPSSAQISQIELEQTLREESIEIEEVKYEPSKVPEIKVE